MFSVSRSFFVFAVLVIALPARSQCLDWYSGFGLPGSGIHGDIRTMIVHDPGTGPKLYACGRITPPGGSVAGNVEMWDGSAWQDLGANLTDSSGYPACDSIAWFDDGAGARLYAGGAFSQAAGMPAANLASWNGTSWSEVGGGLDGWVTQLAVYDDGSGPALYVAGLFTHAGGQSANRIAKWNGTSWSTLGTGLNDYVSLLAVADDGSGSKLYVAGAFTQANGSSANRFARWSSAGWSAMPLPGGTPVGLAQFDDGSGPRLWATSGDRVSRWNGTSWTYLGQILGGYSRTLAAIDEGGGTALYVAGEFDYIQSQPAHNIARYMGGSSWSALGGGVQPGIQGGGVFSLISYDSGAGPELHAGGYFTTAGYWPSASFARWGAPCTAPTITQQPSSVTAVFGQNPVFNVRAEGTAALGYQWRHNGVDLVNAPNHIEGATTQTLTIWAWNYGDAGLYDCVVSNAQGAAVSNAATFTVPAGGTTGVPFHLERILLPPEPATFFPPGTNYTSAGIPAQSATGEIVMTSSIPGATMLVEWDGTSLSPIAQTQTQAPGLAPGVVFSGSGWGSTIAASGVLAFQGGVQGPGISTGNNRGLWFRDASSTDLVVRREDPVPGDPPGNVFNEMNRYPRVNAAGQVVWLDEIYLGSNLQYRGLFEWTRAGGLQLVAREGTPAPGGGVFTRLQGYPELDEAGNVAFESRVDDGSGTPKEALFVRWGGTLLQVFRQGDAVPGLPVGTTFDGVQMFNLIFDGAGDLVFHAGVQVPGLGGMGILCRWSPSGITVILPPDPPAPGGAPGTTIRALELATANSVGDVAFLGDIFGACPTCPKKGLWLVGAAGVELIALSDPYPMPELPTSLHVASFQTVALNDLRQCAFVCNANSAAVAYGWTPQSGLFPLNVPGAQFEIAPGQYRTVSSSDFGGAGTIATGLRSSSLTNTGELAFRLGFTDGSQGVFLAAFDSIHALYHPCPIVYDEPIDARILPGQDATFSVVAGGQEPLAYQWRRNGVSLADGGALSGSTTPTLTIQAAIESDSGEYDVVVTNNCGSTTSAIARLAVEPGAPFCAGDGLDAAVTTPCPCANSGASGHGCANSVSSSGALLSATGAPNPDTVVLHGTGMPPTVSAIYLKGDLNTSGGTVFGDGVRCVDGNLIRMRTKQNAGGASEFPEAGEPLVSVRGQTPPGSGLTGYYQVYYRNASAAFCPPATFNVTNGYRITW